MIPPILFGLELRQKSHQQFCSFKERFFLCPFSFGMVELSSDAQCAKSRDAAGSLFGANQFGFRAGVEQRYDERRG